MALSPAVASSDSETVHPLIADLLDGLEQADLKLPVLPGVATEVLAISADPEASPARLADLIQRDQSLASHVLRVVNSPAYRGANEIVALQQALTRLGMERVRQIALALALGGSIFDAKDYQGVADDCWQIALASGLWGKELARAARKNVELAYLCGLLHNVGSTLVLQQLTALELETSLPDGEVADILAGTQSAAGVLLGRHWSLPQPVCAVIADLDHYSLDAQESVLLAITLTARRLARWHLTGELTDERIPELLASPELSSLNMYPEDLEKLFAQLPDVSAAMEAMR